MMGNFIHYDKCPVCSSSAIQAVITATDHTVSGGLYTIWECGVCTLRFTQDVPDPASIAAYYKSENYISHTNTSKGLINKLYQRVRKITLRQKRNLVKKATGLKSGTLLDVGSGTGAFVHVMKNSGWQVSGIEPDAGARKTALDSFQTELLDAGVFFNLLAEKFDAITLWHVLEHVHDLHGYINQLKKIVKPQGKIFIAVPNYTSKDAHIYKEHWAAYDVPRHLYHFSPISMKHLTEKHGLIIERYNPMWYDSFYISILSSGYKNKKANFSAAFLNGLRSNLAAWIDVRRCSSVIYIISKKSG